MLEEERLRYMPYTAMGVVQSNSAVANAIRRKYRLTVKAVLVDKNSLNWARRRAKARSDSTDKRRLASDITFEVKIRTYYSRRRRPGQLRQAISQTADKLTRCCRWTGSNRYLHIYRNDVLQTLVLVNTHLWIAVTTNQKRYILCGVSSASRAACDRDTRTHA